MRFKVVLSGRKFVATQAAKKALGASAEVTTLGFATTRFVTASDKAEAVTLAIEAAKAELAELSNLATKDETISAVSFVAENIAELPEGDPESGPRRGFTFYVEREAQ